MDSLHFAIKINRFKRFIEINVNDLVPDKCEHVFFDQGRKNLYSYVFIKIFIKRSMETVFSVFGIENGEEIQLMLRNQDEIPIPAGKLPQILNQFKNCAHFMIEVVFPTGCRTTFTKMVILLNIAQVKCTLYNLLIYSNS